MTREEINSALPSKSTYTRAEVVELIFGYGNTFDAIWQQKRAELIAQNDARFEEWKTAFTAGLAHARADADARGAELAVLWIGNTLFGAGLIAYGIFKADPAVIASGVVMAGAGVTRFVILLK